MATAATASHPASASTSGRDALAAAAASPAAVCLVPFGYLPPPSLSLDYRSLACWELPSVF